MALFASQITHKPVTRFVTLSGVWEATRYQRVPVDTGVIPEPTVRVWMREGKHKTAVFGLAYLTKVLRPMYAYPAPFIYHMNGVF